MEKRKWYRFKSTGQRGYLAENAEGEQCIRLDNEQMVILRPLTKEWEPEAELPPISDQAIRIIAFEADRVLCRLVGLHKESRKEWIGLTDDERIRWRRQGPPQLNDAAHLLRRRLFECITEEMEAAAKEI